MTSSRPRGVGFSWTTVQEISVKHIILGQINFEVQWHLTALRIPHEVSDSQAIFLGGHLLNLLLFSHPLPSLF
jgi:hypothetical protein